MLRHRNSESEAGIAIVGPGRLGQAMGRLLKRAGFRVRFVAARRMAAARRAAKFIGSGRPLSLGSPELAKAEVFLLTTSDVALASVAAQLAATFDGWKGKVVLHTCGSLPSSVLTPLGKKGAAIGSLHPFQTVPTPADGVRNLSRGFWAIEGDPRARSVATRWVKAFDGAAFSIRPEKKILYHAAAFLVCPTVVTLLDRSQFLLRKSGVPARITRPMLSRFVTETVRNFDRLGARKALTGPAVRGDWAIIREHMRALARVDPDIVSVYKTLLRAMLRFFAVRTRLKNQRALR
jgi:predicted short-subunit dehydrogenase-like oxidoreductase (DUF2520 family)